MTCALAYASQITKSAPCAFAVEEDSVSIIGVYYGGQDYETALQLDPED